MARDGKRDDAATSRWREAFSGCKSMLEALAKSTDVDGQMAARTWWVICMGSRVGECKGAYAEWKAQAAGALPGQLTAEHTQAAVELPGFGPMAKCLMETGAAIGVDPSATLDHVQTAGGRSVAAAEWARAVADVDPWRAKLQQSLLRAPGTALAPTAPQMGIDELRVCQLWMFGVASRLGACQRAAADFAASAGVADPNSPLKGYDEERWDPRAPRWQELEACVHVHAGRAGTEADAAWRRA